MNPVLVAIHNSKPPVDTTVDIEDVIGLPAALNDLAVSIDERAEINHVHPISDVVDLQTKLDSIDAATASSVDSQPDKLVKRGYDSSIEADKLKVNVIDSVENVDRIFFNKSIDLQGNDIFNSNFTKTYEWTQPQPEAVWVIPHGFGRRAAGITVYNSAHAQVIGSVIDSTPSSLSVRFAAPFTGSAVVVG